MNNFNLIDYRNKEDDDEAKSRLTQIKNVLKNSKTLKEQLKGVCISYDSFIAAQPIKEDQKGLSLMKNFFL